MGNLKKILLNENTYEVGVTNLAVAPTKKSEGKKGLMSPEDKAKLDGLKTGDQITSDFNSINYSVSQINDDIEDINESITDLSSSIDAINAAQNLADIVNDLTALTALAASNKLQANDKVQVLVDANHDDASTVYNWNGTQFNYIGNYGLDSYTKTEIDTKLDDLADTIGDNTTYTVEDDILTITIN